MMTFSPRILFTLALAMSAAGAGRLSAQRRAAAPTLILTDGKVFTADSARPWAEAVAIRGERIVAVGSNDAIRRMAGPGTREIRVAGRVVIPGINDAHDHVGNIAMPGEFAMSASPKPAPSISDVLDSVRVLAARTPKGTWIKTTIGLRVLDDTSARRATLDRASADHPVFLWTWWGHGAVLNSAALRALGIADNALDPLGGWYERDATGRLTGRLDEYAEWGAIRRLYSMQPERNLVKGLRAFADSSVRLGVTTVQDMAGDLTPAVMLKVMHDADLPIRMRLIRWSIPDGVTVSGRKWVIDGTPTERNALRRLPGCPHCRGDTRTAELPARHRARHARGRPSSACAAAASAHRRR
jgi:predicted amidohydrolase YtcJ